MISYNNMYHQNNGSAVLAALNNPPPSLLPVSALTSQLNTPISTGYSPFQDSLYTKTMTNLMEKGQVNSIAKNNPNLSSLMNFKIDTNVTQIKTEPGVKTELSNISTFTMLKPEDNFIYKTDQSLDIKTETDQSLMLKSSHDLFEPSPPKAVPVAVESGSPDPRESSSGLESSADIIQLKPAMAVSQT